MGKCKYISNACSFAQSGGEGVGVSGPVTPGLGLCFVPRGKEGSGVSCPADPGIIRITRGL